MEFAVHLSPTRPVTGMNEGVVIAIGTGRRGDTSVGDDSDDLEQGGN